MFEIGNKQCCRVIGEDKGDGTEETREDAKKIVAQQIPPFYELPQYLSIGSDSCNYNMSKQKCTHYHLIATAQKTTHYGFASMKKYFYRRVFRIENENSLTIKCIIKCSR